MNVKIVYYAMCAVMFAGTMAFWMQDMVSDATVSGIILIAFLQLANILEKSR